MSSATERTIVATPVMRTTTRSATRWLRSATVSSSATTSAACATRSSATTWMTVETDQTSKDAVSHFYMPFLLHISWVSYSGRLSISPDWFFSSKAIFKIFFSKLASRFLKTLGPSRSTDYSNTFLWELTMFGSSLKI